MLLGECNKCSDFWENRIQPKLEESIELSEIGEWALDDSCKTHLRCKNDEDISLNDEDCYEK